MSDGDSSSRKTAQQRLSQVSQHLQASKEQSSSSSSSPPSTDKTSNQRRRRKSSAASDGPPADWSDVLGQVRQLQSTARTPPTQHQGYIRQKKAGKLWVRERIEQLVDPSSFAEVGSASGTVEWKAPQQQKSSGEGAIADKDEIVSFTPSNNIQGLALIGGRKVCLTADDFSLRAGHQDGATAGRSVYLEKLSVELRIPIIKLVDGSSGGGSVTLIQQVGYSHVPPMTAFHDYAKQMQLGIPNIGAILGSAIGLGAARVTACHFSVMAADIGSLFNAGPAVVAKATFEEGLSASDLGGPSVHGANGTVDNIAPDEQGCFEQIKKFLSYVPDCGQTQLPPVIANTKDSKDYDPVDRDVSVLRTAIPRRRARAYATRAAVIKPIFDQDSFFEIGAGWGHTAVVGLARLDGRPVGVIANNPEVHSGATDAAGAQKMTRHVNLCDSFNLPLIQLVDCPGYAIGTAAERSATMKWGVELAKALFQSTMPIFSVIVRRCYGVAGGLHVDCRNPNMRVAWPSLESGSLPLEGGVEAGHSRELREAGPKREQLYDELTRDYRRLQNPVRNAAAFNIEEIIDPADTRKVLCQWAEHMYTHRLPERILDRQAGRIHPVFR